MQAITPVTHDYRKCTSWQQLSLTQLCCGLMFTLLLINFNLLFIYNPNLGITIVAHWYLTTMCHISVTLQLLSISEASHWSGKPKKTHSLKLPALIFLKESVFRWAAAGIHHFSHL